MVNGVERYPKQHPTQIQAFKIFAGPCPTLFLAYLQGTQSRHTKANLAKELKMPTHSLPTPADEYISSSVQHFNNKSLLDTQAHPPPNEQIFEN